MTRVRAALALLILLGALVAAVIVVDTDVRGLLGNADRVGAALNSPEGRSLTLAIIDPDLDKRSKLASEIAAALADHPMVRRVTTAPAAPSSELLDWIWRHRFVLAPPSQTAFTPDSLKSEMRFARAALVSSSDGALADRYLRDPTGSFRRIVATLRAASEKALPVHHGISQARDGSAALLFIELDDKPLDIAAQAAFDAALTERIRVGGAEALLIGPRSISAEISDTIATRTTLAAVVASMLLVLWLIFVVRPASAILICVLPPAIGFGAATLLVQVGFGSVHVLALGFGGALLGLALDYPLHLLAHRAGPEQRLRARRYVTIGAATTAIAFLALLGSGIPAIEQVGLFVASGLAVATISAFWLAGDNQAARLRSFRVTIEPRLVSRKLPVLLVFALVGAVMIWQLPNQAPRRLVDMAPHIAKQIERLDRMVDLPSGRYRIDVTGKTLTQILTVQSRLAVTLQTAQDEGVVARFDMLGSYLPLRPVEFDLPSPEAFSGTLSTVLVEVGFNPRFLNEITTAYRAAREISSPGTEALTRLEHLAAIPGLIRAEGDIMHASARLWDIAAPERLENMITEIGDEHIKFIDQQQSIASGLASLTARVSLWLAIGAVAGVSFMLVAIRRPMDVAEIALGCLAAGILTTLLAGIPTGGIGVFHIVSLTLVIGIGVDYGIFLILSENDEQYEDAMRSVLLCVTTTLIAFITMVFSGVSVLEEIGTTVSIGVIAMVGVNLARRKIARSAEKK
jgi:predicted exporter